MQLDLTNSEISRKNIINNNLAMPELFKAVGVSGVLFENKYRFLKSQLERYYEVDARTIERILVSSSNEISNSGY